MEKIKQNKLWITIVVIGIIVIGILLAMLHQQKQNSPEAQSSSYASSVKSASDAASIKTAKKVKLYGEKAAKTKGHIYNGHITTWTEQDFVNWANDYLSKPHSINDVGKDKEKFGTSVEFTDSDVPDMSISNMANNIHQNGTVDGYYKSFTEYHKDFPDMDPDDIKNK